MPPHQFTSEDEVLAAAAGPNPEITIVPTDEVYRCSVVGRKKQSSSGRQRPVVTTSRLPGKTREARFAYLSSCLQPGRRMGVMLTADMRAVIQAAHLCFAATVSPDGMPNVSPKGTIGVWDDQQLFFLDLASPGTRANLQTRPWMELNVVEQLSRRGYRFFGPATLHVGDAIFEEAKHQTQGRAALPARSRRCAAGHRASRPAGVAGVLASAGRASDARPLARAADGAGSGVRDLPRPSRAVSGGALNGGAVRGGRAAVQRLQRPSAGFRRVHQGYRWLPLGSCACAGV